MRPHPPALGDLDGVWRALVEHDQSGQATWQSMAEVAWNVIAPLVRHQTLEEVFAEHRIGLQQAQDNHAWTGPDAMKLFFARLRALNAPPPPPPPEVYLPARPAPSDRTNLSKEKLEAAGWQRLPALLHKMGIRRDHYDTRLRSQFKRKTTAAGHIWVQVKDEKKLKKAMRALAAEKAERIKGEEIARARRGLAWLFRNDGWTYKKIGEYFDVTVERARQMVRKADRAVGWPLHRADHEAVAA